MLKAHFYNDWCHFWLTYKDILLYLEKQLLNFLPNFLEQEKAIT